MMPRPGTQALVVSRADKIVISALFASSLVRNNICCKARITFRVIKLGRYLIASPSEAAAYSLHSEKKPKSVGCKIEEMHTRLCF